MDSIVRKMILPGAMSVDTEAAWTPASLPGILDWATVADAATDAEGVITWTGREGSIILAQTTGSAKPQKSGGVVVFDGGDWLATDIGTGAFAGSPQAQPNTVALRFRETGTPSGSRTITDGIGASNKFNAYFTAGPDSWRLYCGSDLSVAQARDTNWHSGIWLGNGASSYIRRDGVTIKTGNANTNSVTGFQIGAQHAEANFIIGEVKAWVWGTQEWTGTDLTNLETWLGEQ